MSHGEWLLMAAAQLAQNMVRANARDQFLELSTHPARVDNGTKIMISVQMEEHGPTWWVRWVDRNMNPIESHYCSHLIMVISATATILDKAGIKL